ncbi:MAG: hypothetical protein ACI4PF_02245 [Christensenellales bacterium]
MKTTLQELTQQFKDFSTKKNQYEIDDRKYIVVSHFVGKKDINEVLTRLAIKQAYSEI